MWSRAERQKGKATRLRLGASRIVQASQGFPGKLAAWPFLVWARRGMIWRISKVVVDGFRSLWANALNGASLFPKTPLLCQDLLYCSEQQGSSHCKQCPKTPKILFFPPDLPGCRQKNPLGDPPLTKLGPKLNIMEIYWWSKWLQWLSMILIIMIIYDIERQAQYINEWQAQHL